MKHTQRWAWMLGALLAVMVTLVISTPALAAGGPPDGRGAGVGPMTGTGAPLTETQEQALVDFLLDEHKALATYQSVMAQFGTIEPFASIAGAEERHIAVLERVFARYGVALPEVPDVDVPAFETPEEAAEAAMQAEIDNADLYDRLSEQFTQADILRVTANLSRASLENHLPAFEAFANGEDLPYKDRLLDTGVPQGGPRPQRGMRGGGRTFNDNGGDRMPGERGPSGQTPANPGSGFGRSAECGEPRADGEMVRRGRWSR